MEQKRLRFLIIVIIFLAAGAMIYPTIQWYVLLSPEEKAMVEITSSEMAQVEKDIEYSINSMRDIVEQLDPYKRDIFFSCWEDKKSENGVRITKSYEEEKVLGKPLLDIRRYKYLTKHKIHQLRASDYIFNIEKDQVVQLFKLVEADVKALEAKEANETDPNKKEALKKNKKDSVNFEQLDYEKLASDFIKKMNQVQSKLRELNLVKYFRDIRKDAISLGLDIAGGISLVLELDSDSFKNRIVTDYKMGYQKKLAEQKFKESKRDKVISEYRIENNLDASAELDEQALQSIEVRLTNLLNKEVEQMYEKDKKMIQAEISEKEDKVTDRVIQILQDRINQFGVSEPIIERGIQGGYITISLPGATNRENAISVVTRAGNLSFLLVDEDLMNQIAQSEYRDFIQNGNLINRSLTDIRTMLTMAGIPNRMNNFGIYIEAKDKQDKPELRSFIQAFHLEPDEEFFTNEKVKSARLDYDLNQAKGTFLYATDLIQRLNSRLEILEFDGTFQFVEKIQEPKYNVQVQFIQDDYKAQLQELLKSLGYEVPTADTTNTWVIPTNSREATVTLVQSVYNTLETLQTANLNPSDPTRLIAQSPFQPTISIGYDLEFIPTMEAGGVEDPIEEPIISETPAEPTVTDEANDPNKTETDEDTKAETTEAETAKRKTEPWISARYKDQLNIIFKEFGLTPDDRFRNISIESDKQSKIHIVRLRSKMGTYLYWKKNQLQAQLSASKSADTLKWEIIRSMDRLLLEENALRDSQKNRAMNIEVQVINDDPAWDLSVTLKDKTDRIPFLDWLTDHDYLVNRDFKANETEMVAKISLTNNHFLDDMVAQYADLTHRYGKYGLHASVGKREGFLSVGDSSRLYPYKQSSDPNEKQEGWTIVHNHLFVTNASGEREYFDRPLTGANLTNASPDVSPSTNQPIVAFQFDSWGADQFSKLTTNHKPKADGKEQRLAIVLDGSVKSAPVIRGAITGGRGIIEGAFTIEEVQNLVGILESGSLPASLMVVSENIIEPSLGESNVIGGTYAAFIGLIAMFLFMIFYYRFCGLIANVALVFNWFLLFAVLSSLKFTLTLSGIAGMVLTLGMAVDANVLIYERIREELRGGKTTTDAIFLGFNRAFFAIFDSNLTTLISAMVLMMIDISIVKGFGVTLFWGIIISMITALFMVRFILDVIVSFFKIKRLSV